MEEIKQYDEQSTVSVSRSTMYPPSQFTPYNPDTLVRRKGGNQGLSVYEEMRNDDAVKAGLFAKKAAILSAGWSIKAASDEEKDKEIADFITNNFKDWLEGNFDSNLYEMLSALDYGFSVTEKVYDVENGKMFLKCLKTRPPHSFEFDLDDYGNFKNGGLSQWSMSGLESLPIDKFVIYSYNKEFDNYYGNSDLRAAYRSWFSKDNIIKFQLIFLERFGNPLVLIKYDRTASAAQREEMKKIAENISATTGVVASKETEISILESTSKTSADFNAAIQQHNSSILRAILMPNLLGFGDQSGGSYALGKKQSDMFIWVLSKIRNEVETLIDEDIIRELVILNFGEQEKYPHFLFNPLGEDDNNAKATIIIDSIQRAGLQLSENDENYLRGLLGMPERDKEEVQNGNEAGTIGDNTGSDDTLDVDVSEFKLKRQPTKWEAERVDFQQLNKDIDENVEKGIVSLSEIIAKMRDDFTSQILNKKIIEKQDIKGVADLEFKFIREYSLTAEGILRKAYDKGEVLAKDIIKKSKKDFAKQVTTGGGLVKTKAIQYLKEKARMMTADIPLRLQNTAKEILIEGVKNGDDVKSILSRVDDAFADYVDKYANIKDIETIVDYSNKLYTNINTNIASALSTGMDSYNKDLEQEGEIIAYRWSAVLDGSTTEGCQALDGLVYAVDDPVFNSLHYPRHFNCRSVKLPVLFGEMTKEEMDSDIGVYDEF